MQIEPYIDMSTSVILTVAEVFWVSNGFSQRCFSGPTENIPDTKSNNYRFAMKDLAAGKQDAAQKKQRSEMCFRAFYECRTSPNF